MDDRTMALLNTIVQAILMALVLYSGYTARVKKDLRRHCILMRVAVIVLIITTVVAMLPSLSQYVGAGKVNAFYIETLVHHTLGLLVLLLWLFVNLAMLGIIKVKHRLRPYMWIASGFWLVTFVLGVHMYFLIWL
jgi:putative membrane protein